MKRTKEEIEKARAEHLAKGKPLKRRGLGRPKGDELKERLTIYLTDHYAEHLKSLAKNEGRTISGQVEYFLKKDEKANNG